MRARPAVLSQSNAYKINGAHAEVREGLDSTGALPTCVWQGDDTGTNGILTHAFPELSHCFCVFSESFVEMEVICDSTKTQ